MISSMKYFLHHELFLFHDEILGTRAFDSILACIFLRILNYWEKNNISFLQTCIPMIIAIFSRGALHFAIDHLWVLGIVSHYTLRCSIPRSQNNKNALGFAFRFSKCIYLRSKFYGNLMPSTILYMYICYMRH